MVFKTQEMILCGTARHRREDLNKNTSEKCEYIVNNSIILTQIFTCDWKKIYGHFSRLKKERKNN